MIRRFIPSKNKTSGFTIIEVIIVLAVVGLIFTVIFYAIPQAQASRRDAYRKTYAGAVYGAIEEYYKNNKKFPGCLDYDTPSCTTDVARFITNYLPSGQDPSTGVNYVITATTNSADYVKTTNNSFVYYDSSVSHDTFPERGQIYIGTAHWCYSTKPDSGVGPPLSGTGTDGDISIFAVVIYLEKGGYYCLDNYANR